MKKLFRQRKSQAQGHALERGSALLIVLGFLSFMMVSAVSFAIYMRIERQASSNYRHAITARHMLNAALFRAIDEIDGELRIQKVNTEGDARPVKFPNWPGRTRPSAVVNGQDNGEEARVLSMEALSFIPGVLVNDVRRYAVTNQNDSVSGVSLSNNRYSYLGAKWRRLSMPVASLGSNKDTEVPNAFEEAVVGRYSYVCINVSDMLDVNVCKAAVRDSGTNRVSIGQFFGPNSQAVREKFDDYVETKGIRFETLQDFYACMFANPAIAPDTDNPSPFHDYMKAGNATDCDAAFDEAGSHVFITDALAKAQPANARACNILLQPPIAQSVLTTPQTPAVTFQNTSVQGRDGFETALNKALAGRLPANANVADVFPLMLADYIDEDNIPKALNTPSVEMAPMISQIFVPDLWKPEIFEETLTVPGPPPHQKKIYKLRLGMLSPKRDISVEVFWPFKYAKERTNQSAYEVEMTAVYHIVKKHRELESGDSDLSILAPDDQVLTSQSVPINGLWTDITDPSQCYKSSQVSFVIPDMNALTVPIIDSEDGPTVNGQPTGFEVGTSFSVSLVIFARIKSKTDNKYVDSVPQELPVPPGSMPFANEYKITKKLFFQTKPSAPVAKTMALNSLEYEWNSLEVPDPRFNYNSANWLGSLILNNAFVPGICDETKNKLLGKDGRDGDIFLSVSNAGKLSSPGELGFILRPFRWKLGSLIPSVSFKNRTAIDSEKDDSDAYFRTVRLYDHDNADATEKITKAQDPIYQYFTAQNADGSVAGARVNPLSDMSQILTTALDQTPADYWFASRSVASDKTIMRKNTYNQFLSSADWNKFTNAWSQCFITRLRSTTPQGKQMRSSWQSGLPDYYGGLDTFGWYSEGDAKTVFSPKGSPPAGVPATLSTPLHEIDRKMLYSFSLDSFSDRQQLFLYILRAEVTVPSFGSSQESGVKSLAGGRAVALVWRDPYPEGYDKAANSWTTGNWYPNYKRFSPWYQVNIKKYDDNREEKDTAGDPSIVNDRFKGFHQNRILYFKQLDD